MVKKVKKLTDNEKKEIAYGKKLVIARAKNEYIRNLINGRYYIARVNMISSQLIPEGKILESVDGNLKSREFLMAEYGLIKMQAIMCMRDAHFNKIALKEEHKLTDEEIAFIEEDYYNGKMIREEYDAEYNREGKAKFVGT